MTFSDFMWRKYFSLVKWRQKNYLISSMEFGCPAVVHVRKMILYQTLIVISRQKDGRSRFCLLMREKKIDSISRSKSKNWQTVALFILKMIGLFCTTNFSAFAFNCSPNGWSDALLIWLSQSSEDALVRASLLTSQWSFFRSEESASMI